MKTITDLTLSNLIEPLQELTIELYNNLTSHEIKREIEFKTSLLLSYYISIMISLIVFIFSLVFFVLFTKSIEKNLFYILRTVQSDVILEIQQKFNKLLAVEKSNRKSPKFYAHCNLIWSFSIMTISSIFFPFYISIMLLINDPSQFKEMPPYLNISNQDELAYYTLALTEFNISDQKSCFHNYSMIECSDCIKISKMFYLDSHIIIVNVMIVAFSISFVVFIFEYYHSIEMYDTVQILLRFIPIHASESNPILKALWYGQNLTKSDVHHLHKHLILRKIKNTGFFGVLYFNEEYETIKTIGNVVDILHYHPTSLWRLSTYIREHSSEKGELIDQFFSEKKNLKTISISLEAFHEVSFTFSNNGKILTLKDDGQHHLINQQNRAIMNSKHFLIPRRTVFENCIICICGNYLFFESNHSIFTSITKINGLKDVFISICQVEHAKEIFELAMNSKVKICFNLNGMICFFQKIKPNSPQNIYGKAYEEAKLMFKLCTQDELVFSTNFGKLLNFPQVILFEHVSFTHDIEIDIHRVRKYHLSE